MPNRLFVTDLVSVGLVAAGDNEPATVEFWKSRDIDKRDFSPEQREKLAEKGQALPDGSFPIVNTSDLKNAIQAFGRAKSKPRTKAHIIRRAKALGKTDLLPETWVKSTEKKKNAGSVPSTEKVNMDLSVIEDGDVRAQVEAYVKELQEQIPAADEDIAKDAEPEVQEFIAKLQADQDALRKELDEERTARRTSEYVAKAKAFTGLLGPAEEVGPVLADLADKAPDSFAKLETALTAASQREGMAALFSELGSGEAEGESDPLSKQAAWVAENRQDGETIPQAKARFWAENPDEKKALREG